MARVFLLTLYKPFKNYQIAPPLGICYLSSCLKQEGHEVRLVDLRAKRKSIYDIENQLRDFQPDIVGFSSLVLEHKQLQKAAELVKKINPSTWTVVGGPFANSLPQTLLSYPDIDLAVQGEGEKVMCQIAAHREEGTEDFSLPGMCRRINGEVEIRTDRCAIEDLDSIPFPDWGQLDLADYHEQDHHGFLYFHKEYMSVITSRGCPYRCVFCHNIMGKRFRKRGAENIVTELETLKNDYGIREITISDDVFNLDRKRAKKVCDLILEKNLDLKFTFPSGMRGDVMDRELLEKLKAIGTYKVAYGIETGSKRLQKLIRKDVELEKLTRTIRQTSDLGIIVQGFFLFGFPTETLDDLKKTVRYCLKSKLDLASFNIVNAFPGTELHDMATKMGIKLSYQLDQYDYDTIDFQLSEVDTDHLKKIIRMINIRFYLSPLRLIRIFRRIPVKSQMLGLAGYFFRKVFLYLHAGSSEKASAEKVSTPNSAA